MSEPLAIKVDGQTLPFESQTTAAVAALTRTASLRLSINGQARGPLCGMGVCFECRVSIDGQPHRLSCQTPCHPGMEIQTTVGNLPAAERREVPAHALREDWATRFDVLVVGGGPAGLAAACTAAEAGQHVGMVDDNPHWGGQIWRGAHSAVERQPQHWFQRAHRAKVELLAGARVIAAPERGHLLMETHRGHLTLGYDRLILATGARELFLPFPGWTLPNVMGAGGLQALVKSGLPIRGKRVIVAGTGPLLLAVAAYLRKRGAVVPLIAEQAPFANLLGFGLGLWRHPAKWLEAVLLRWKLRGVALRTAHWPMAAHGTDRVVGVSLTNGHKTWTEPCDYLACGFGLVPNVELPLLLGCAVRGNAVQVDGFQQTTVPGIYCAGETTGVGGLEKSLVEGTIAGLVAAGRGDEAQRWFRRRQQSKRFANALARAFAVREELKTLARSDTVVCRCEDVTLGQLRPYDSWRAAKLQTRCGMGPCQGRICGSALAFLRGWQVESVRPPVFPARVESLIGIA
jgi:D-hydroxyproline dehydrogenase subunit alpha